MNYKIEKDKILPRTKYPFDKMKKGDSFLEPDFKRANTLKASASMFSKFIKGKMKFSVRKEEGGYRCYRIK